MKLTVKPWVRASVRALTLILWLLFAALVVLYILNLDKRVTLLEDRPLSVQRVEVEVTPTPTATPSGSLKRVVPTAVPTK